MIIMKAAYNSYVDSNITTIIPVVKKVVGWFSKTKGNSFLSEMDSDDIIGNALTDILVYQNNFNPEHGTLEGWVAKIALNACKKMLQERSAYWINSVNIDTAFGDTADDEEEANALASRNDRECLTKNSYWIDAVIDSKDIVNHIISKLSASDRRLLSFRNSGYSYKEIAEITGSNTSAVGKRIHDMMGRIDRILYDEDIEM